MIDFEKTKTKLELKWLLLNWIKTRIEKNFWTKLTLLPTCVPTTKFLGQGFQKLEHEQTDTT